MARERADRGDSRFSFKIGPPQVRLGRAKPPAECMKSSLGQGDIRLHAKEGG